MKELFLVLLLFNIFSVSAQRREEIFDENFRPTTGDGRYYVVTKKEDSLWHRQAFYLPGKNLAMDAWYRNDSCTVATDTLTWFHPNEILKSVGQYVNGKKEGVWLSYNELGYLSDSANYHNGFVLGIEMRYHTNGMLSDSLHFDGSGNGVQISWDFKGFLYSAGYLEQDTLKKGRWKYYFDDGKLLATEDYVNGKKINCSCYDSSENTLNTSLCTVTSCEPPTNWNQFLKDNLRMSQLSENGVPAGLYIVLLHFIVDEEGNLTEITAATKYGHGLEDEAVGVAKMSPKWTPAVQFGHKVKTLVLLPVTMMITSH